MKAKSQSQQEIGRLRIGGLRWSALLIAPVIACYGLSGCGGSDEGNGPSIVTPRPSSDGKPSTDETVDSSVSERPDNVPLPVGSLAGVVTFEGEPPVLAPLIKTGETGIKDAAVCAAHDIPDQSLVVNAEQANGIANVFVYLLRVPEGARVPPAPEEAISVDQNGCEFEPHASIVRVGQPILVTSKDAIQHNVHTSPIRSNEVNRLMDANDRVGLKLQYDRSEPQPVRIKCDIHPWMSAYQLVLDHPFMAVTDSTGRFEIKNLPVGKHEFRIWHERGLLNRAYEVEIREGETTEAKLTYSADKFGL